MFFPPVRAASEAQEGPGADAGANDMRISSASGEFRGQGQGSASGRWSGSDTSLSRLLRGRFGPLTVIWPIVVPLFDDLEVRSRSTFVLVIIGPVPKTVTQQQSAQGYLGPTHAEDSHHSAHVASGHFRAVKPGERPDRAEVHHHRGGRDRLSIALRTVDGLNTKTTIAASATAL